MSNEALGLADSIHAMNNAAYMTAIANLNERNRKQAERIAELEARVHTCGPTCSKAGCINRRVTAERDQLRAEVIANRERDALKLAALHIHSEMRSIVQAGGSNEAIGREFRKRVILDVEDEVFKLRAEVERLRADGERLDWIEHQYLEDLVMGLAVDCEHDGQYYVCGDDNKTCYGDSLRAAIDLARTTHKETK